MKKGTSRALFGNLLQRIQLENKTSDSKKFFSRSLKKSQSLEAILTTISSEIFNQVEVETDQGGILKILLTR